MRVDEIQRELAKFAGAECWHVSRGGPTAPSFELALGKKIPRTTPLKNLSQPPVFRFNDSELGILVWCSWRLIDDQEIVASSCEGGLMIEHLDRLLGREVEQIHLIGQWDLRLEFDAGARLDVFCDRPLTDETLSDNWELWTHDQEVSIGPGLRLNIEERQFEE